MGFSYHTKTVNDWKTNTFYVHAIEIGPRLANTPVFINLGLGVDYTHISKDKAYINSWNLHVPLYLGALIGNTDSFHLTVKGGCIYNCLLQQFHGNSETNINSDVELQLDKRSSWFGSLRLAAGYSLFNVFIQYDIPLSKDEQNTEKSFVSNDNVFRFGICFGI